MPALVGPFAGFALGVALAWLCRAEAARDDDQIFRSRAAVAALFAALVYAPVCAYFLSFAGDWSLAYLADSRAVPSAAMLLLVVADAALVVAGFVAGYRAARARNGRALPALAVGPAAVVLGLLLALYPRLRTVGTFHQVSSHFGTQPVAGSPVGYAILWMSAMLVAGFAVAARALVERPRAGRVAEAAEGGAPKARQQHLGRRER